MRDPTESQERAQLLNDITRAQITLHFDTDEVLKTINHLRESHSFFIKQSESLCLTEKTATKFKEYLSGIEICGQQINEALQKTKQYQLFEELLYQQSPDMAKKNAISWVNIKNLRLFCKDIGNLALLMNEIKLFIEEQAIKAKSHILILHTLLKQKLPEQEIIEEVSALREKANAYKMAIAEKIQIVKAYEAELKNKQDTDFLSQFIAEQSKGLPHYHKQAQPLLQDLLSASERLEKHFQSWPNPPYEDYENLKASWITAKFLSAKIEHVHTEAESKFSKITILYQQCLEELNPFPTFKAGSKIKSLIERIIRHWERNPSDELAKLVSFITGKEVARLPDTNEHEQFSALQYFLKASKLGEDLSPFNPKQRTILEQVWFDCLNKYIHAVIKAGPYQNKIVREKDYFVYADLLFYPAEVDLKGNSLKNVIIRLDMLKKLLCIWSVAANKLHRLVQSNLQLELYQTIHGIFAENYKLILVERNIKSSLLKQKEEELAFKEAEKQKLQTQIAELAKAIAAENKDKAQCETIVNEQDSKTKLTELESEICKLWEAARLSETEIQRQHEIQNILEKMRPLSLKIKKYTKTIASKEKEKAEKTQQLSIIESNINSLASILSELEEAIQKLDTGLDFFEALKRANDRNEESPPTYFILEPELPEFSPARIMLSKIHSISFSHPFFGLRNKESIALESAVQKISLLS